MNRTESVPKEIGLCLGDL